MTDIETAINARRTRRPSRVLAAATAAALTLSSSGQALAQARGGPAGLPMLRDAEIEQLLRDYTQPILRAAGLAGQNVRIIIVNDRSFNAFVVDGKRIF